MIFGMFICNKIRPILAYLSDNYIDTAFISETWPPDTDCYQTSIIKIDSDFNIIHSIKTQQQRIGGVGLIFINSLSRKTFNISILHVTFEFFCMKMNSHVFRNSSCFYNLLLISLYCFHLGSLNPFVEKFDAFFHSLANHFLDDIVTGFFNMKLNNSNDNDAIKLCDALF